MNRLTMIVFRNLIWLPWTTIKLFGYAADHKCETKQKRYELLKYITRQIQMTGNVGIDILWKENIPKEDGFIFYPNHQGLFDGVAMVAACDTPFSPVIKHELMRIPFVRELFQCLDSYKPFDENGTGPVTMEIHFLKPIFYGEYGTMKTTEIAELVKGQIQQIIYEYA